MFGQIYIRRYRCNRTLNSAITPGWEGGAPSIESNRFWRALKNRGL